MLYLFVNQITKHARYKLARHFAETSNKQKRKLHASFFVDNKKCVFKSCYTNILLVIIKANNHSGSIFDRGALCITILITCINQDIGKCSL